MNHVLNRGAFNLTLSLYPWTGRKGYGKYLWIMQGMFRANGGCGYLRKPELLMSTVHIFDPRQTLPPKIILKVTVYLGEGWHLDFKKNHFDRFSPPDFYTRVCNIAYFGKVGMHFSHANWGRSDRSGLPESQQIRS